MSALTEADHEEVTDTLLAARERIEHLTICGAALQAENDRLKAENATLIKNLAVAAAGWQDAELSKKQLMEVIQTHHAERLAALSKELQ